MSIASTRVAGRYGEILYDNNGTLTSPSGVRVLASMDSWKLSMKKNNIDVTCFNDTNKVYVPGIPDLSGSLAGQWDLSDQTLFSAAEQTTPGLLKLIPDINYPTYYWMGPAYLDADIDVTVAGSVKVSGSFIAGGSWSRVHP